MYEENYNNKEKGGVFVFTLPVSWNPNLDKLLSENKLNFNKIYYFKKKKPLKLNSLSLISAQTV